MLEPDPPHIPIQRQPDQVGSPSLPQRQPKTPDVPDEPDPEPNDE